MGELRTTIPDLDVRSCRLGHAHTKVVASIGPASEERIGELIEAGMSVARINFSHGTSEDHIRQIQAIRRVADELGAAVGILADINGPKMRLGTFPGGTRELEEGEVIRVVQGPGPARDDEVPFDFGGFFDAISPGHRVFLADGGVELVVEEGDGAVRRARVRRGGTIGDRKGVHLPDTPLDLSVPTERDEADLALARAQGVDMIGVSFVSRAAELERVRALVPDALMVAKIERKAALDHLDELLAAADGVMVARGDLGVEMELEQVPMIQKALIHGALVAGRFTITATEMLESMVTSSRPTRAEVADVANAVFDGTDALMLSAETAVGAHPVEAVQMMDRIATAVETSHRYAHRPREGFHTVEPTFSNATAMAAVRAAEALALSKIVCFTETGNTVRQISRYRPTAEVIALTPNRRTLQAITVLAHVRPIHFPHRESLEDMLESACCLLLEIGMVARGEQVVFVAGVPLGVARSTNVMKLHRVGETVKLT